jgi:hypothetical protein
LFFFFFVPLFEKTPGFFIQFHYLIVRPGILGQAQDAGSEPLGEEKRKCCSSILSGIIEVVLNTIGTELEKGTEIKKADLEKEIIELADLHDSLDRIHVYQDRVLASEEGIYVALLMIHPMLWIQATQN